jgi:hypothetical protein
MSDMRTRLLDALNEVLADHSVASTQGMVHVLRRHVCDEDPELDCALIRAQFIIASRRYLRAPKTMVRFFSAEAPNEPAMRVPERARRRPALDL